jgi:DNA-binding response OmpR family regulator
MLLDARQCTTRLEIDIVIVDARRHEYTAWAREMPARIAFCTTAEEALEFANRKPALWVIQAELPDSPGLELHRKLCSLGRQATSLLVNDRYESGIERAALAQGSLLYRAKPLDFVQLSRFSTELLARFPTKRPPVLESLILADDP